MATPSATEEMQRSTAAARSAVFKNTEASPSGNALAPVHHPQQDFLVASIFDAPLHGDHATMEHAIFLRSQVPNLKIRVYQHSGSTITITRSASGLATILDKDSLPFTISCLVETQDSGLPIRRSVCLRARDMLAYRNRGVIGTDYHALARAFKRLARARIRSDIRTGKKRSEVPCLLCECRQKIREFANVDALPDHAKSDHVTIRTRDGGKRRRKDHPKFGRSRHGYSRLKASRS